MRCADWHQETGNLRCTPLQRRGAALTDDYFQAKCVDAISHNAGINEDNPEQLSRALKRSQQVQPAHDFVKKLCVDGDACCMTTKLSEAPPGNLRGRRFTSEGQVRKRHRNGDSRDLTRTVMVMDRTEDQETQRQNPVFPSSPPSSPLPTATSILKSCDGTGLHEHEGHGFG